MESILDERESEGFLNLVAALPDIVYVLDEGGHFIYVNDAVKILGYTPAELLGEHFSRILREEDSKEVSRDVVLARIRSMDHVPDSPPKLFDERRTGARMTKNLQVRILRKGGGEEFFGSVNAYGEYHPDPVIAGNRVGSSFVTMGIVHDVTAEILYQRSLEANLAARELLLREIHHRVKDNLQMVASLAHLREMEMGDSAETAAFDELIARVKTIAMVHDALYRTENLEGVRADEYFRMLANLLEETYGVVGSGVRLEVSSAPSLLPADLLANLAMIAHELVSNSYRHAFPRGRRGAIRLDFEETATEYTLTVFDDGIGMGKVEGKGDGGPAKRSGKLGLDIVSALARQIGADLKYEGSRGTKASLTLRKPGP